jgi:multiple sugar transport system substrate-binding protein
VQYRAYFTGRTPVRLAQYHGALALYYNKDLFDQYGVDYPEEAWDHDDYVAAMKRLTHDRDDDGETDLWGSMIDISWERIQVHVNEWGGHFVDPQDPARSLIAEPPALQAMEWIRSRMWDDGVMPTSLQVENQGTRDAFVNERVAMVEDGSWALKDILANARFRVGIVPFRRDLCAGYVGSWTAWHSTLGRNTRGAWELLRFLIGKTMGGPWPRPIFSSQHGPPSSRSGSAISARSTLTRLKAWTLLPLPTATSRAIRSSPRRLPTRRKPSN